MKIRYESEVTGKLYDTEEALIEAEAKVSEAKKKEEAKRKERAEAAKKVNAALDNAIEAQKEAQKVLKEFCDKYGTFKTTLTKDSQLSPFDLFSSFFNF